MVDEVELEYVYRGATRWKTLLTWWRYKTETFSALLVALCAGNSPVTGEFPHKGQWRFDTFFDLGMYKRSSKHSRGWWFETPVRSS